MTTESHSSLNLAAGQKLAGCYLLDHFLDAGADHPIWIAQDEVLGKEVSLHFLPAAATRDSAAIEALRLEIKRNRPLIHPSILRVFDLVEGPDWTAVAMESFEGRCLAAVLREQRRFEVDEIDAWLDQVCVGLEEAHRIKLTHRDLAPENIFLTSSGRLMLANFGISRIVQTSLQKNAPAEIDSSRSSSLSPQLLAGDAPSPTDDVYGVGALLFQLLTGHPVFDGADVSEKIKHTVPPRVSEVRDEAPDPGAAIPAGWENVIAACLNKRTDERPSQPLEIVSSIEAYTPISEPAPAEETVEEEIEEVETVTEPFPTEAEAILLAPQPEAPAREPEPEPGPEPAAVVTNEIQATHAAPALEPVVEAVAPEPVSPAPQPEPPSPALPAAITETPPPTAETPPQASEPERAPQAKAPPKAQPLPRPIRYYDAEKSGIRRFAFPAAVAATVIVVLLLINWFYSESKPQPTPTRPFSTVDSTEQSELTSVKNSVNEPAATKPSATREGSATPALGTTPASKPVEKSPATPRMMVVAGPTPRMATPIAVVPSSASPVTSDKQLAEKTAALERLKADLANAEKTQQARLKEQQAATAAFAEAQKAIEEKTKSVAAAKKVTDELMTVRKKRQEEQKAAETAALAAQELAAEKARAADEAKKALADFETQNRDKLAAQDKADAEIQGLQRTLAERQKAAEEATKAIEATEGARTQQLAAIKQSEREIEEYQTSAAKAAADEAKKRQSMDSERRKLDDEISAMRALFEQKMKDIEDRRRQLDGSSPAAPATPAPVPAAKPNFPPSADLTPPAPPATATPAPTPALPLMAAKTETPKTSTPAPAPAPAAAPGSGWVNSLGMRFVPLGDVFFCVWQTRVKDFEAFANATGLKSTAWRGPGFRQGPDHPVVNVTWNEALAFCKWLSDRDHKDGSLPANQFYRLPYDLEWSKAVGLPDESGRTPEARDMGIPDVYPWGTDWPPPKGAGNYTGEETGSDVAIKGYDDGFAWTSPVGSFPPNKAGLYDMGGNVWQWCMDSWNNESKAKVLRGASWYNGALKLSLLSSCRIHASADSSTDNYGFRIVRTTETVAVKPAKK